MKINAMMNMSYSFVRYKRKKEEMEGGREAEGREEEEKEEEKEEEGREEGEIQDNRRRLDQVGCT